jgi:hypothetical protein
MKELKENLLSAIRLTGTIINDDQLIIVDRGIPHKSGTLPLGKMGVYSFIYQDYFLKIGKAGPNSNARFNSQHYDPKNSQSNLAKSILNDPDMKGLDLNPENIDEWIKQNTRRIDFLLEASLGIFQLNLVEAFLHLKFKPKYEGFENQRKAVKNIL